MCEVEQYHVVSDIQQPKVVSHVEQSHVVSHVKQSLKKLEKNHIRVLTENEKLQSKKKQPHQGGVDARKYSTWEPQSTKYKLGKHYKESMKKSGFFENINKIDKPLVKPSKKQRESRLINKIRNEQGDITMDTEEIQRIFRSYFENLLSRKLENLKEMDSFLDKYDWPKLNHDQINSLNRPITPNEIEAVIKGSQPKKAQGQMDSLQNYTRN